MNSDRVGVRRAGTARKMFWARRDVSLFDRGRTLRRDGTSYGNYMGRRYDQCIKCVRRSTLLGLTPCSSVGSKGPGVRLSTQSQASLFSIRSCEQVATRKNRRYRPKRRSGGQRAGGRGIGAKSR
jgi:hypothetical protein